jgi:hypothetical protein
MSGRPGDASLAGLIRDYGDRWVIEKIERGAEWVACQRDDTGFIVIISARDLGGLRYKLGEAKREDVGESGTS